MKSRVLFALAVIAAFAPALPLHARSAPQAGSFKDWHDIDEVTIVKPFQLANYKRVLVAPVETKGATLPDANDNSYREVKAMLANATAPFTEGLRGKLRGLEVANDRTGGDALVVRARIQKSEPGSQAARYFGGFGAGAAQVQVAGEIVDGKTGKTLVHFVQERRSGVGAFGGGYRDLLERSLRQIGGDVAGLLRAF